MMNEKQVEALRLAREALEIANSCVDGYYMGKGRTQLLEVEKAITAIDEALAEQQSGVKQVIELYDSPEQPAQQDYWQEEARRYAQNAEFWRGKYEAATAQQQEPVAWINWCAATGKRSVSFECESELASQPLYEGITQNTHDHYSNENVATKMDMIVGNLVREGINKHRARELAEHFIKQCNYTNGYCTGRTDLLAEQKAQQPVATMWQHGETGRTRITMPGDITDCDARWFKAADLYTSPPIEATPLASQRSVKPWRGLTDEELADIAMQSGAYDGQLRDFARDIEAKLRELNEHREKNT